jgi:hypothetical protein
VSDDRRLALIVTAVAVPLGIGLDLIIDYSPYPGYGVSIGLLGCIAIIIGSKWVGKSLLDRPRDYYADDAAPDVQPDVLPPEHPDAARAPADALPAARLDPTSGTGEVRG